MSEAYDVPMVLTGPYYMVSQHCGYCNCKKSDFYAVDSFKDKKLPSIPTKAEHVTIGSQVEQMTYQQYDDLINRGFRRSGTFLYKQDMLRNCCRLFTIRTRLQEMKINKQHRKTINRFIRATSAINGPQSQTLSKKGSAFDLNSLVKAERESTRFYTVFGPSKFSDEKFELYKKYQIKVHNDDPEDISKLSFKRFLCDNPFPKDECTADWDHLNSWTTVDKNSKSGRVNRYVGSAHDCYYLDGKLIAISVVDLLPSGMSSIYFIWDPDYSHLSLGTLSGLRELMICDHLNLDWYYLGYYIDDCPKMQYKLKFGGELLDVCTETYFPISQLQPFIKNGKFFVIEDEDIDIDLLKEIGVQNSSFPQSESPSKFQGKCLKNISDSLYGNEQLYLNAENIAHELLSTYGVNFNTRSLDKEIPSVVPGLIPLWQIKVWLNENVIGHTFVVNIYALKSQQMILAPFDDLQGSSKRVIIDCIRLYGLDKVKNSIILT
ncbi:uncharacterized protein PRCAT00003238001 [Priceomyces carsonii]|uniref:uncharacterized protein n=1 Tax=Priceomyces carsonii TaxID=28549 RepID=UPI002ED7E45A|nr:unnamed protein product [Priceomyces carsonii]